MDKKDFSDLEGVIYSKETNRPQQYNSDNSSNHMWCNYVGYGNMSTVSVNKDIDTTLNKMNRIEQLCLCSDTPVDRSMAWTDKKPFCKAQNKCEPFSWKNQVTGYTTYPNVTISGNCTTTVNNCKTPLPDIVNNDQQLVLNTIGNINDGSAIQLALLYAVPCRINWLRNYVKQECASQDVYNPLLDNLQKSIVQNCPRTDSKYYVKIAIEISNVFRSNPMKGNQMLKNYIKLLKTNKKYTDQDHIIINHPSLNRFNTISNKQGECAIYKRRGQYNFNTPGETYIRELIRDGEHYQFT